MGAPGARQRRVQRGDGGPIGEQRLDLGAHAPGQVAGDRGGLDGGVAQIEDEAGRAPRRRGGQLHLNDDGCGRITHDNSSTQQGVDESPTAAGAGPQGRSAGRRRAPAGRKGPAGQSAGIAGLAAASSAAPRSSRPGTSKRKRPSTTRRATSATSLPSPPQQPVTGASTGSLPRG